MLTERRELILKVIVSEYVDTVTPVPSELIVHKYQLGVSPATVRNEMVRLEEEGYIIRPHTSAGAVPTDKGYRFYVQHLAGSFELSREERLAIKQLFQQVEHEIEEWIRLAATVLARTIASAVVVTFPQSSECHYRHIELVSLQKFLVLMVLLLKEMRAKQRLITVDRPVTQEELLAISNKFNSFFEGMTHHEIYQKQAQFSTLEKQFADTVLLTMQREDKLKMASSYLDGLRHLLNQPEFYHSNKVPQMMNLLEERNKLMDILSSFISEDDIQVIIGRENKEEALQECSMVLGRYGIPGEVQGIISVFGPTRMHYGKAISSVRYVSSLMNKLVEEVWS